MFRGEHEQWNSFGILGSYIKQFEQKQHMPTKDESIFSSIWHDQNIKAFQVIKRMAQGLGLFVTFRFMADRHKIQERKMIWDRISNQSIAYFKNYRTSAIIGLLVGLGWYIVHDCFLCPHGFITSYRHFGCYMLFGGLFTVLRWNPNSMLFGSIFGLGLGLAMYQKYFPLRPGGVELQITGFDPEVRQNAIRDQMEAELSQKLRQNQIGLKSSNHYIL